uniref:Uncharacterized protein n=1 Tax=Oryza nivara TaxID=4536 RepID=A0A0E0FHE0_ORYNI
MAFGAQLRATGRIGLEPKRADLVPVHSFERAHTHVVAYQKRGSDRCIDARMSVSSIGSSSLACHGASAVGYGLMHDQVGKPLESSTSQGKVDDKGKKTCDAVSAQFSGQP